MLTIIRRLFSESNTFRQTFYLRYSLTETFPQIGEPAQFERITTTPRTGEHLGYRYTYPKTTSPQLE